MAVISKLHKYTQGWYGGCDCEDLMLSDLESHDSDYIDKLTFIRTSPSHSTYVFESVGTGAYDDRLRCGNFYTVVNETDKDVDLQWFHPVSADGKQLSPGCEPIISIESVDTDPTQSTNNVTIVVSFSNADHWHYKLDSDINANEVREGLTTTFTATPGLHTIEVIASDASENELVDVSTIFEVIESAPPSELCVTGIDDIMFNGTYVKQTGVGNDGRPVWTNGYRVIYYNKDVDMWALGTSIGTNTYQPTAELPEEAYWPNQHTSWPTAQSSTDAQPEAVCDTCLCVDDSSDGDASVFAGTWVLASGTHGEKDAIYRAARFWAIPSQAAYSWMWYQSTATIRGQADTYGVHPRWVIGSLPVEPPGPEDIISSSSEIPNADQRIYDPNTPLPRADWNESTTPPVVRVYTDDDPETPWSSSYWVPHEVSYGPRDQTESMVWTVNEKSCPGWGCLPPYESLCPTAEVPQVEGKVTITEGVCPCCDDLIYTQIGLGTEMGGVILTKTQGLQHMTYPDRELISICHSGTKSSGTSEGVNVYVDFGGSSYKVGEVRFSAAFDGRMVVSLRSGECYHACIGDGNSGGVTFVPVAEILNQCQ